MSVNEWGELAEWNTTSRKYQREINRLRRKISRLRSSSFYTTDAADAYQLGLLTWEHARALMGIKSSPKDPRWGRFFVAHNSILQVTPENEQGV